MFYRTPTTAGCLCCLLDRLRFPAFDLFPLGILWDFDCRGRDELVTMFFEEPFMQAIQTNCPWLLRYLVTAIILTKVRQ